MGFLFFIFTGESHQLVKTMLTLEKLRKIEPEFNNMTDEEVEVIVRELYNSAEFAFDVWWSDKNGSKNPSGLLSKSEVEGLILIWKPKKNRKQ